MPYREYYILNNFDRQELLLATKVNRDSSNYVEYTYEAPAGWYAIYPLYDPTYTVTLVDFGILLSHGGEATVRFTYDPTISFISQKLPQVGDVIGLITYFKEQISPSETFHNLMVNQKYPWETDDGSEERSEEQSTSESEEK